MPGAGLRFAMLTTFYPPYHFGGDAMYVRRLTHALARRGHTVDVIHDVDAYRILAPRGAPEPEIDPSPPGVEVHRLESRAPVLSCLATHQLGRPVVHGRRIRRLLESGRYDVIHYHNVSLVGGPALLGYGDAIKLYTAHEHWLVCPSHILWRHGREPCPERECLRCVLRSGRPPQVWRRTGALDQAMDHVDRFLSPSRFSAEKHREFGFRRDMHVMPLFLPDAPRDAGADDGQAAERPYFLFVGRLEAIKGLQDVIPLFAGEEGPDLLVAGGGDYEPELRRLASGCPRVRFLGRVAPDALPALYRGARAMIAPSRCFEVFPMVLLEAFREGTPVIARRLGPFPEAIEASGAGLLFETPAEAAAAITRLHEEPGLRDRLGAAGRQAFERLWTEEVGVSAYLDVVREVAEKKGRPEVSAQLDHA